MWCDVKMWSDSSTASRATIPPPSSFVVVLWLDRQTKWARIFLLLVALLLLLFVFLSILSIHLSYLSTLLPSSTNTTAIPPFHNILFCYVNNTKKNTTLSCHHPILHASHRKKMLPFYHHHRHHSKDKLLFLDGWSV